MSDSDAPSLILLLVIWTAVAAFCYLSKWFETRRKQQRQTDAMIDEEERQVQTEQQTSHIPPSGKLHQHEPIASVSAALSKE